MNKTKFLLVCFCLTFITCLFSGCSFEIGGDGDNGLSPYEISVQNGYRGTEKEWLESVKLTSADYIKNATNYAIKSVVSISTSTSSGTGVIIDYKQNLACFIVVTNYHILFNQALYNQTRSLYDTEINCYLYGEEYSSYARNAVFLGGEIDKDIAFLSVSISRNDWRTHLLKKADIDSGISLSIGKQVIALGNGADMGIGAGLGIISQTNEQIEINKINDATKTTTLDVFRFDASVVKGCSGGGVFDTSGKLVGIICAKSTMENNFSYAIPINDVMNLYQNI